MSAPVRDYSWCSCNHSTAAGREWARYVDPPDMGKRILPTSFHATTVHSAVSAIEAEERQRVLGELRDWAKSHRALQSGDGDVDDVLGFIAWIEAASLAEAGSE